MSWELTVRGGKTVTLDAWNARLRGLGATLEHHPQFGMHVSGECLPVALTVLSTAKFSDASRFARFGPIAALLQFEVERFGPLDPRIDVAATAEGLDQRFARLGVLGAPDSILEHERERRASLSRAPSDEPDEQRVYVMAPEGHLLIHTLASAAYALASGGVLAPMDIGGKFLGDAILGWMADRLTSTQLADPAPFRGWT